MSVNAMWTIEESIQIHDVVYRYHRGSIDEETGIVQFSKILGIRYKDAEALFYNCI